jgi:hypothetical protein
MHAAASKIDPSIQQKIIAVVMYGDPGRSRMKFPDVLQRRLFENCAKGDFVSHTKQTKARGSYTKSLSSAEMTVLRAMGISVMGVGHSTKSLLSLLQGPLMEILSQQGHSVIRARWFKY